MLGLPVLALAAEFKADYVTSLLNGGLTIVRNLLIFLVSLAVVWFIWNVVKYSMSNEDDGKTKAKDQMIHGIIAIAVIVSVWGLVTLLQSAFLGGSGGQAPTDLGGMIPQATNYLNGTQSVDYAKQIDATTNMSTGDGYQI